MIDPGIKGNIQLMFRAKDFEGMWFNLKNWYEQLGFADAITDQERIDEYTWIVQQLRKYMFSKQDDVLACDSVEEMIEVVDSMIGNAQEYGADRRHVVYNFVRDHWLYELRNHLGNWMIELSGYIEDKEDEDE